MACLTLIHNVSCSKSQCVYQFLTDNQIDFVLRDYVQQPLCAIEIKELIAKTGLPAAALLRHTDPAYAAWATESGLGPASPLDTNAIIEILTQYPQFLQRPVLVWKNRAVIGRPFEAAQSFLQENGLL